MSIMRSAPTSLTVNNTENVNKAIKAFVALCCSDVLQKNILLGNQNRLALPANTNEYVIFTPMGQIDHGVPVVTYAKTATAVIPTVEQLEEVMVQIDCFSDTAQKARYRAQNIVSVARTVLGVDFFSYFGLSVMYADPIQNTTVVVDAEQYVQRYTTTLHLSYTHSATLNVASFANVEIEKVVPVDGEFPPNQ